MTPEQIVTISNFLNTRADLPVEIQAIAEELKVALAPQIAEQTAADAPEAAPETVTPDAIVEESTPAIVEEAPSEEVIA